MKIKFVIKKCCPNWLWRILKKIRAEISREFLMCIFARIFNSKNTIFCCNYVFEKGGKAVPNNWGDDLNIMFFPESTGKRFLYYPNTKLARLLGLKNYVLIGSSLVARPQKNSIIWGTGAAGHLQTIFERKGDGDASDGILKIAEPPKKVLAVRGPLTREWLLRQGIECPKIFGDPALLLPRFYKPKVSKKRFRVGVIPHVYTSKNFLERVECFCNRISNSKLIFLHKYKNWRDIIDEICSCDFIVSESLHGLIASAAYGVPATWIEFIDHVHGWEFKFYDFYASLIPPPPMRTHM